MFLFWIPIDGMAQLLLFVKLEENFPTSTPFAIAWAKAFLVPSEPATDDPAISLEVRGVHCTPEDG